MADKQRKQVMRLINMYITKVIWYKAKSLPLYLPVGNNL